jgi:hypothetical protein
MWFDVQAALAEIECEPAPRVAHVAHVARIPAPESETVASGDREPEAAPHAPDDLSPDERDQYEERAAILEYDGGFPKPEAERRARLEIVGGRDWHGGKTTA